MTPPLTLEQARALFAAEVDAAWLADLLATPDGAALLDGALAMLVLADEQDASDAASLLLASARRAKRTTAPLFFQRTRPGPRVVLPANTRVGTADGVVFLVDDDVALFEGQVGVDVDTTCTAELPGHVGVFPAGSIDRFAPVLPGLSGAGTSLTIAIGSGVRFVKLLTDTSVPHPFRQAMAGSYVRITASDHPQNVGRLVQIAKVNDGSAESAPSTPEGAGAFSPPYLPGAAETLGFAVGAHAFEWEIVQWADLGIEVRNYADATTGDAPSLEAIALDRGVTPGELESTSALRKRLSLAPQPPTPLGLLRKLTQVLPFGSGMAHLQVYEPQAVAPDPTVDPYAANFPAWGGFLADVHVANMPMTDTPQAMAERRPGGVTVPGAKNPGLSIPLSPVERRVIVRWLLDGTPSEAASRPVRLALLAAARRAKPPGVAVELYHPRQHGYP